MILPLDDAGDRRFFRPTDPFAVRSSSATASRDRSSAARGGGAWHGWSLSSDPEPKLEAMCLPRS